MSAFIIYEKGKTPTMSAELHPDYQDILTQNYHLFSRYLYAEDFIPELISKDVLSINDKDIITNPYVNQTRRQRATALIDVLLKKGPRGYDCFLEILEFQYPHVFKDVAKREPRPLPHGAPRNRHSDRLRLLDTLPTLAHHIKEQYKQNENLSMQLSVLEGLMTESQVEKQELEKELESCKKLAKDKEREAAMLKAQNEALQADVNRLHEEKVKELEKSHQIRDERDDLKQKVLDLQIQIDQRDKSKSDRQMESKNHPSTKTMHDLHLIEHNKILQEKVDEWTDQANQYADRLTKAQEREMELLKDKRSLKQKLGKAKKEQDILERERNELKLKNETYLERIRGKIEDIFAMEDQKRGAEKKVRQVEKEKAELFEEVHRLENKLQDAKRELERLKARLSGSSQDMSSSAEDGQEEVPRRINRKCKKNESTVCDSDSDEHFEPEEDMETLKSNTLPNRPGKFDSPEMIFQQEVAHLRWSLKDRKPLVNVDSVEVEIGSFKRKPPVTIPTMPSETTINHQQIYPTEMILQANLPERVSGPICHSEDPNDTTDQQSTGTSSSCHLVSRRGGEAEVVRRKHSDPTSPIDYGRPQGIRAIHISAELGSDFPSHDVYSVLLPRSCEMIKHSGIQASSSLTTVTVKLPILNDKFEITGGNHTGIFVSKVNKTCNLMVGDQIKEVIYTPNEVADPVETSLQGCTLDEAHRLLGEEFIRRRKEKEVKLRVRKSHQEYDIVKQWIVEQGGTGDFFYIRCNFEKKDPGLQQKTEETTLRPGEIFLVRDTHCDQRLWAGYKINDVTGDRAPKPTRIFNKNWARRKLAMLFRGTSSEEEGDRRQKVIKIRGQVYERVLPMKASVKLPVIVFGPDALVESTMNLIANNLSQQFTVKIPSENDPECFELYRQDTHTVWKGKLDKISSSQKHIQKIIFLLQITSENAINELRCIFGPSFSLTITNDVVEQCRVLRETLLEKGFQIEDLCFPELTSKESLLSKFRSCVQSSQDRILWLSQSEMDFSVAEKYLTYLGPDLSKVMVNLQYAQSMDEVFTP